jgi:hypothetical protein
MCSEMIQSSRRLDDVSYYHHQEVVKLEPGDQE